MKDCLTRGRRKEQGDTKKRDSKGTRKGVSWQESSREGKTEYTRNKNKKRKNWTDKQASSRKMN